MRVLVLSCNTGEGHNAAGRAIVERVRKEGHEAELVDMMMLSGRKTSRIVGGAYVGIVNHVPGLFRLLYKAGGAISSARRKSPVYYANALMAKKLKRFLDENPYDVIAAPHLFPAETLTYMKKKQMLKQKVVAVSTDYTCIPFWEETDCDYYIIPHEDLKQEYISKGIPEEKLLPYGIPVRLAFSEKSSRTEARELCRIRDGESVYLVMGGSMGFGKIQLFVAQLARKCTAQERIIVICGNNRKLERLLRREMRGKDHVRIIGFTDHVAQYMDACDVVYSKPGGLTSTEALVKGIPLVHTKPIPGCETKNLEFFTSRGMSVSAKSIRVQISEGRELIKRPELRERMNRMQRIHGRPQASYDIYKLLLKLSEQKEPASGPAE